MTTSTDIVPFLQAISSVQLTLRYGREPFRDEVRELVNGIISPIVGNRSSNWVVDEESAELIKKRALDQFEREFGFRPKHLCQRSYGCNPI